MAEEFYSIGKGEIRQDALLKVTGQAEYTTDIHPRGMVYGKILGSPTPPGIIKSIDTSEAEKLPGVVCVVTGEDGPDHPTIGGYLTDRYIMNRVGQKVRYVGDFVAAVAATDEQIAEAAGPEYPGYVMKLGSAGDAVMQLQLRMNQVAVLYCAAEFVPVDGVFGETTDQAVRLFQEGLGLPVTGVVDEETWQRIYELLNPPIPASCANCAK